MTQALIRGPIVAHVIAGAGGSERPSGPVSKRVGVGDVVVRVDADDEAVELFARHAGRTSARLEMEYESGVRD